MVEFTEKRESFRIGVDCEIEYRKTENDSFRTAQCVALSGIGLSFITRESFKIDDELEVALQSPIPDAPQPHTRIKVINVRALADQTYIICASITLPHDEDSSPL